MKLPFTKPKSAARTPPGLRLYAIGDIHGMADALDDLTARIEADAAGVDNARLVFLGDYVDRGPDSAGVIDRLIAMGERFDDVVYLKGNHEAAMLEFLSRPEEQYEWLEWGGDATLRSYKVSGALTRDGEELAAALSDAMPEAHHAFLRSLSLTHRAGDYFFVHAGVRPGVPLDKQEEEDLLWIRGRFHDAAKDERPDLTIVHGHHAMKKPVDEGWRIGVDTGACWSGTLTAVVLEDDRRRFLSTG